MIRGKNKNLWRASGMLGLSMLAASAQAALITVTTGTAAGQAVYDDVADLTWIKNAELARTETFGVTVGSDGRMTWVNALAWVAGMNAANYLGFDDWRLPDTLVPDATCDDQYGDPLQPRGRGCTGSEFGDLYHRALGVTSGQSILTSSLLQGSDPIFNFTDQFPREYWSATEAALNAGQAWAFVVNTGSQRIGGMNNSWSVWAVRDGNAGEVAQVPLPGTLLLMGLGALGLLLARRRTC